MRASLLTPEEITKFWPLIQDALTKMPHLWADKWTLDYYYQAGVHGHMQFWGFGQDAIELFLITHVARYPSGNSFLLIDMLFGEGALDEALPTIESTLRGYAKIQNCEFFEIQRARFGWDRKLAPLGIKSTGIVLAGAVKGTVN